MNKLIPLILAGAALQSPNVIYGPDNRIETVEASVAHQKLAASTAALISESHLTLSGKMVTPGGRSLDEVLERLEGGILCPGERFKGQVAVSHCSGFLVAPDIIATAGHCYPSAACTEDKWVFGYKLTSSRDLFVPAIPETSVYSCADVIVSESSPDFALIRLDRRVEGVEPVKLARKLPAIGTALVVIGHPSGLPQKVSPGAKVRRVTPTAIHANLDTFRGNSGSAVFNEQTGEAEGILVNGAPDYDIDRALACVRPAQLPDSDGKEGITPSGIFLNYLQ